MLQKIKYFAKKYVTWLYLMVDITVFMTAEIFSFYYQFWFKLTDNSESSETSSRFIG